MKMNNSFPLVSMSLAIALLLDASACGKKSKDKSTAGVTSSTPGVVASDASVVALTGKLALPLGLTDTTRGVLAFKLVGGESSGDPQVIDVDADGNFSLNIDKSLADVDYVNAQLALPAAQRDANAFPAAVSRVVGVSVDEVKQFMSTATDDELKAAFQGELDKQKKLGTVTLLVAYDKSGDKVAEANSFRFIGMPTASGANLSAIDTQAIKGNLSFGSISAGEGDDATSQLAAGDALSISTAAQESLASSSKALRSIKNRYMNTGWRASSFFVWQDKAGKADATDKASDPASYYFDGTGFYVGSTDGVDTPFAYDDVCGASAKAVKFTPPSPVDIGSFDNQGNATGTSTVSTFQNTNLRQDHQGDNRICLGDTFYAREDGTHEFMLNFGRLVNPSPEGLWKLTYDGTELARFDLDLAWPVVDSKPIIYMPLVKFITTAGKVSGIEVQLAKWNGTAYVVETDLSGIKKLIKEANASVTRSSDQQEMMASLDYTEDNGKLVATFDADKQLAPADASAFAFYYQIGDANYRVEFR